ncbi:MAG: hypothetical protein H0V24_08010 [Chloroflexia bacterium]|nr:hypothetical protein [Chloroflexia bacterium]
MRSGLDISGEPFVVAEPRNPLDNAGSGLIYCGLCGALNPATNHFCAACGTTLVDAFHANEGLRVYERPDPASRLIEIIAAGTDLDLMEDANAPADYVRIRLNQGRMGYIRLGDVAAGGPAKPAGLALPRPDINTHARGCVSTTGALAALALLVIAAIFGVVIIRNAGPADAGILTLFFCITVGPLLILTVGLYVGARGREDRLEAEAETAGDTASHPPS